jgi:diketogulonate reductase-like aldo/keto reductase
MKRIPTLTLSSGNKIPKIGIGTWTIGGKLEKDPANDDRAQIAGIQYALDHGITLIRTAQNYAAGYCEELVGKVIKKYDRNKLYLISCVNQNFALDAKSLIKEAEKSLKRLGTDYFDLYLIGAVNYKVPISKMAKGLLYLKDHGLARDIGTSNYRMDEFKVMQKYTDNQIVYNEMHYNLLIREPEVINILEYCRENKVILCAYRPLQLCQLAKPGIAVLDWIAYKNNKTQAQIALKWLLGKEGVITITKMTNPDHIDQALDLFSWKLPKEDIEKLDQDFPVQTRMSDCSEPRPFIA